MDKECLEIRPFRNQTRRAEWKLKQAVGSDMPLMVLNEYTLLADDRCL